MFHHLKGHCPKDRSKLVDALRPVGFGSGAGSGADERDGVGERENVQEAER